MNQLLQRRKGKIYFGHKRINMYECACWLQSYNRLTGENIRPSTMTAEMFREFLAYQRRVRRVGYVKAPILRERITLSAFHARINEYAAKLSDWQRGCLMARIAKGERLIIFNVADNGAVTLAEQRESVVVEQLGPQQPPAHPWIYNRQMPDGTYRDLAGFFNRE